MANPQKESHFTWKNHLAGANCASYDKAPAVEGLT